MPPGLRLTRAARHARPLMGRLVLAGALVQLVLFAYATAPGLAGTSDSRLYLYAAHTLRTAGQLLHPDGLPYRYWPPLYPLLLAAVGSLANIRLLHGVALLGSLLLWSWLGRQLLPRRRALLVPLLLALSTPALLVGKFVWAECVFMLLVAAYLAALLQWLRSARGAWMAMATVVGLLLPLQRTLGLFVLAGAGVALLGTWRHLMVRGRWLLLLHLLLSGLGGVLWQTYALLVVAAPSRYHPPRGWTQLLSSAADYGFVLGRWLLPLPASMRAGLPNALWAVVLLGLFAVLWPRRQVGPREEAPAAPGPPSAKPADTAFPVTYGLVLHPPQLVRWVLWAASVGLVGLVAALTVFAQSAAGIHDAERYASVLFGPVVLLVLAAWPARAPRWLSVGLLGFWVLALAFRVVHVAQDLRRVRPLADTSVPRPVLHGQGVGAVGEERVDGFVELRMRQLCGNFG